MSAKIDLFCDRLLDRLNAIEQTLESVKAEIQALPWKARQAHQIRLREARARLHAQKDHVEQTRANLKSQPQPVADFLNTMFEWATKPPTPKLNAGPDAVEKHAAATIHYAVAGIDEVKDAMLYTTLARIPAAV